MSYAQHPPATCKRRDRTGEPCGPYVVTGPVGADPLTSLYWRIACPDCGHTPEAAHSGRLGNINCITKKCKKCGRVAP